MRQKYLNILLVGLEILSIYFCFYSGYESNQHNSKVIHNIVNDRSDLTLKDVISRLQSDVYSDKATMSTIVKTICKRYFTGTSVCIIRFPNSIN